LIQVVLFELDRGTFALKLEAVERILAPGEPAPAERRLLDLARSFDLKAPAEPHLALLAGGDRALVIGRPVGAARIDPAWILPLPGYMFGVRRPPFRGLIDIPTGRRTGLPAAVLARRALLLDEGALEDLEA
jgi:hypothetical protein